MKTWITYLHMDTNWKRKFPIVTVWALARIESLLDHAHILLTTGTPRPRCKDTKSNSKLDGYNVMVFLIWLKMFGSNLLPIVILSKGGIKKICVLRKYHRGWARHTLGSKKSKGFSCDP
jgi:hypothetical protein